MVGKALLLGMLAVPLVAVAGQSDPWYITPQVGGISPDYQRSLEDQDWLVGIGAGRELSSFLNLELNFDGDRLENRNGPGHLDSYATSLDLLGVLDRGDIFSPYVTIGAGVVRNRYEDFTFHRPDQTHLLTQAGLGAFIDLWQNADGTRAFALRPQIKARWDAPFDADHRTDYIATLGFQFSFGAGIAEQAALPPPPPPTPPPARPTPPPPPPPQTAAAPVPETHHIVIPTSGSVTLVGVTFAFNSASLTESSRPVLDDTAQGLKEHSGIKVEVQGYTDGIGSARYNLGLSQRRADAVREYLIGQGVDPGQLTARGYGKSHPVATNATGAGRAENRRVVLYVLSNPAAVAVHGAGTAQ
ncbi:MAG: OmpA family protein [Steroidobacteraceae bacterium]